METGLKRKEKENEEIWQVKKMLKKKVTKYRKREKKEYEKEEEEKKRKRRRERRREKRIPKTKREKSSTKKGKKREEGRLAQVFFFLLHNGHCEREEGHKRRHKTSRPITSPPLFFFTGPSFNKLPFSPFLNYSLKYVIPKIFSQPF